MWKEIRLPYIFERMMAFSVTVSNRVVIISYEGIHTLNFGIAPFQIQHDLAYPEGGNLFDWASNTLKYQGQDYGTLGLYGGTPRLTSALREELVLRSQDKTFSVLDESGQVLFQHRYQDLSRDWAAITFASDDKFIVLGVPYDLYLFQRD